MLLLEGFKLGMLLQITIGPVGMYIFSLGVNKGFLQGFLGVLGVTLADGIFITSAVLGVSSFIKNKKVQYVFNIFGSLIILLFGLEIFLSYFGISFIPKFNMFESSNSNIPFIKAFLLTASSPMTILFWMGIFSTKASSLDSKKNSIILFSVGALLSTPFFLSGMAYLGTLTSNFLSDNILKTLNLIIGSILMYLGAKKGYSTLKK